MNTLNQLGLSMAPRLREELFLKKSQHMQEFFPDPGKLYAWYGHKLQEKLIKVTEGSFLVLVVEPDDWKKPSLDLDVKEYILSSNSFLSIPKNRAFGYKSLESKGSLKIHSNFNAFESLKDNYRFDKELWYVETFMF